MVLDELGPPAGKTSKLDSCKGPSCPHVYLANQASQSLLASLPYIAVPLLHGFCLLSEP